MTNKQILDAIRDEMLRQKIPKQQLADAAKVGRTTLDVLGSPYRQTMLFDSVCRIAAELGMEIIVRKVEPKP